MSTPFAKYPLGFSKACIHNGSEDVTGPYDATREDKEEEEADALEVNWTPTIAPSNPSSVRRRPMLMLLVSRSRSLSLSLLLLNR